MAHEHEEFHGDMSRNEVELDLNKFMALLQERSDLKDQIRELELDERTNPWFKWIHFARTLDAWRLVPRAFFSVYIYVFLTATQWFMALPDPTMAQSGLISIIVGAGAAWFGLYVNSGGNKNTPAPTIINKTEMKP